MHHKLAMAGLSALVLLSACSPKQTPSAPTAQSTPPKKHTTLQPAASKQAPVVLPSDVKKQTITSISITTGRPMKMVQVIAKTPTEQVAKWANQHQAILTTRCDQPLPKTIQRLKCHQNTIDPNHLKPLNALIHFDGNKTPVSPELLNVLGTKQSLQTLLLADALIRDRHLSKLKGLSTLRTLDLSSNKLTGMGLVYLKESANLNVLNLEYNRLQSVYGSNIAAFSKLVYLNVSDAGIKDKTIEGWEALTHLKVLDVSSPSWSIKALDTLHQLKSIEMIDTGYDGVWFNVHLSPMKDEHLAKIGKMTNLTALYLKHTQITDQGMRHIANLTNLQSLTLDRTTITDNGMQHIKGLKALKFLSVYKSKAITGKALNHLKGLKNLRSLSFGGTQINDADLALLASWKHITYLGLCNADHVTEKGLAKHDFKHLEEEIRLLCKDEDHNCDHD